MTRWFRAETFGAALMSLAMAMLVVGSVLAAPSVMFADDGSSESNSAQPGCGVCSNHTCTLNVPGNCGITPNGPTCDDFTCTCNCKTVNGANYPQDPKDRYCDCGELP